MKDLWINFQRREDKHARIAKNKFTGQNSLHGFIHPSLDGQNSVRGEQNVILDMCNGAIMIVNSHW